METVQFVVLKLHSFSFNQEISWHGGVRKFTSLFSNFRYFKLYVERIIHRLPSCRVCYTFMYDIVLLHACIGREVNLADLCFVKSSSTDEEGEVVDEYLTKKFRLQKYTSQTCWKDRMKFYQKDILKLLNICWYCNTNTHTHTHTHKHTHTHT